MKKLFVIVLLEIVLSAGSAAFALKPVPDLGNARIIVLAHNLQNYYINYSESSRPSYNTEEGLILKTQRIVEMMLASNADIFAFCEVEAKPVSLQYIVDSLNSRVDSVAYAAVADGINVQTDSYDNAIKAGFIYRIATVEPYGNNYSATSITYYKNNMRIQAWTEKATGERFTLSMNHFKAKFDEASIAKRVENANWLVSGLNSYRVKDPDILIVGDLNSEMGEECLTIIQNNGYEEQLLRYDEDAYSYVYRGDYELIDHAFANSTMADQITGAAVWHTNTPLYSSQRYSDHDAVLVGLRLGEDEPIGPGEAVESVMVSEPQVQKILRQGQLIIIRGGAEYTVTGQRLY